MGVDKIFQKAKDSANSLTDKLSELKENFIGEESKTIMDEFKDAGTNKAKEIADMLDESKNLIPRAGYELTSINAALGLPPQISLSFSYQSDRTEEEKKNLLAEVEGRKVLSVILKCLFKAGDFYKNVQFKDFKLGSVDISLSLTPSVNVRFIK